MQVNLAEAIALLKRGDVVAIPTETVYGLAADAGNDIALQKVFATKQRPADHPLIVHIGDINQVNDWASVFPETAVKLATAFWPGALTLVLPAQEHVSRVVRGGEPTIALRVPNHPVTLDLLKQGGLSVAAPSANLFTQLSPTTAAHVEAGLGKSIPVLDGGACSVGIESTIVSVTADGQWLLLRPGMISEDAIAQVAGMPQQTYQVKSADTTIPKAPGQHALHYSPRTPMLLFSNKATLMHEFAALTQAQKQCAALLIGAGEAPNCVVIQLPNQPELVAERLYSALHSLDDLKVDCLLVELPPNTPEWAAVLDRLNRAGYQ
ncbi:MAG TPA: L-threonylcarbamoyladenylate synthase [Methylotenera sp.]|nr:L-threonylcarbamoyladenylate synthase [Methylotenera sp.]